MLTISELASYAGVTVRAVRFYHQKGLLPEPASLALLGVSGLLLTGRQQRRA